MPHGVAAWSTMWSKAIVDTCSRLDRSSCEVHRAPSTERMLGHGSVVESRLESGNLVGRLAATLSTLVEGHAVDRAEWRYRA